MGVMDWVAERTVQWQVARLRARMKAGDLTLRDREMVKILGWRLPGDSAITDPYQQLSTVYACITIKARNIAAVPFKLYERSNASRRLSGKDWQTKMALVKAKAAEGSEVTSGVPWLVFQRPNALTSRYQFWEMLVIDIDGTGDWFVWKDSEEVDGFPASLWRRDPRKMSAVATNGYFSGWKYTNATQIEYYDTDEVLHDKYAHPTDEIRGLSPLVPLGITIEAMYDAVRWNRAFFKNNATPDIAYTTDKDLTRIQRAELEVALQKARENMQGAHKSILLEGGLKPVPLGYTQRDMQYSNLLTMSKEDICMALHVPKSVLSMYEDANYAFALSADRSFWTETECPLMTRIEDEFNRGLLNEHGLEGYFDLQAIDALNYAWMDKIDAAVKLWNMQFTANEINERLNLGFEERDWRSHPFEGMGYPPEDGEEEPEPRPVTPAPVAPPPTEEEQPPEEEETQEQQEEEGAGQRALKASVSAAELAAALRERRWRDTVSKVRPLVGQFNRALKNYWHDVGRKVMDRITKRMPVLVTKGVTADNLDDLDEAFRDDTLSRLSRSYIGDAEKLGIETEWKGEFDLVSPGAMDRVSARCEKIVGINDTAVAGLKEALQQTIKEGIERGMSEAELAKAIYDVAKDKLGAMESRARTQARTEMHGAYSEGRYVGMTASGAKAKTWVSSHDDNVRDTHFEMDGKTVAFDEEFTLPSGVTMAYPMDPDAEGDAQEIASETINCRCILVAEYEDADGNTSYEPPVQPAPSGGGPALMSLDDIVDVKTATQFFQQQGYATNAAASVAEMKGVSTYYQKGRRWGGKFTAKRDVVAQAKEFDAGTQGMIRQTGLTSIPAVKNVMLTNYKGGGRAFMNGDAIVTMSYKESALAAQNEIAARKWRPPERPRFHPVSEEELKGVGWSQQCTRHEWGHVIDGSFARARGGVFASSRQEFDDALHAAFGGTDRKSIMKGLSEYAATNKAEAWAEGWTAYSSPYAETRALLPARMHDYYREIVKQMNARGGTP
jgi:HK97 family phage portal protein